MKKQNYEMEVEVTQLGATSEVVIIGLDMICLAGEEIKFREWYATVDDLAAGKLMRIRKFNSNDTILRALVDESLDNQHVQNSLAVDDANTTGTANQVGSSIEEKLFSNQYIRVVINDTLDATKKMYFRATYSALINPLTLVVIGAGITLTTTKHELV